MATKRVSDLTTGELRILTSLWEIGPSCREQLVQDHSQSAFEADLTSVVDAGLVTVIDDEEGKIYVAAVPREDSYRSMLQGLADKLFEGSMLRLVQTLFGERPPTAQERAIIERHLQRTDSQSKLRRTKLPNDETADK